MNLPTIHFPIGAPRPVEFSLRDLVDLAPQIDRFVRSERIGSLSLLLDRYEIPRRLQPETIRQLAGGSSLFSKAIERAAEQVVLKGFKRELTFGRQHPETLIVFFKEELEEGNLDLALMAFDAFLSSLHRRKIHSTYVGERVSEFCESLLFDPGFPEKEQVPSLLERLRKASLSLVNEGDRAFALESVAFSLTRSGYQERAVEVCEEAIDCVPLSRDYILSDDAIYGLIARTLRLCGSPQRTAQAFDRLKVRVRGIRAPLLRAEAFQRAAYQLTEDFCLDSKYGGRGSRDYKRGLELYAEATAAVEKCRPSPELDSLVRRITKGRSEIIPENTRR